MASRMVFVPTPYTLWYNNVCDFNCLKNIKPMKLGLTLMT